MTCVWFTPEDLRTCALGLTQRNRIFLYFQESILNTFPSMSTVLKTELCRLLKICGIIIKFKIVLFILSLRLAALDAKNQQDFNQSKADIKDTIKKVNKLVKIC